MLSFLLDWFSMENDDTTVSKIIELIQAIGGYSISGKDIRKMFAILRDEKGGCRQQQRLLLLGSIKCMLKEKGPTAFFEFNGSNSVRDAFISDTCFQSFFKMLAVCKFIKF